MMIGFAIHAIRVRLSFRQFYFREQIRLEGINQMGEPAGINPQRTIEFDEPSNAYIIRDKQSVVRAVLHNQKPVVVRAAAALEAAKNYVLAHVELLKLDPSQLSNLDRPVDPNGTDADYRFLSEKRQFDVTTVTFQQVYRGWPVWRSGIAVHLKHLPDSFHVISAHVPRHNSLTPGFLDTMARDVRRVDEPALARQLGLADDASQFDAASLRIVHQHPMVYRYDAGQRELRPATARLGMRLLPIPADIVDGSFNTVSAVFFDLAQKARGPTHWVALVDAKTGVALYTEEFVDDMDGSVFLADPATTHGGPMPNGSDAALNPLRVTVNLPNLIGSDPQLLRGTNIQIVNIDGENIRAPVVDAQPGASFQFNVRTDDFSAVNAYYNCDRFFSLVESWGFKRDEFFSCTTFPIAVDHRGAPTGGITSTAAQTRGTSIPQPDGSEIRLGILAVVFALAQEDAEPPIGNADDWRVVLHELGGHGTLLNHVGSTKFLFAHSVGDSMAAILNDPESKAANQDKTFPWIGYDRRHNRTVANGWSWDGPKDLNDDSDQLDREQILSTTHFNLYKAIGGGADPSEASRRRFAAKFTTYLMLRAIQTLTHPTNPQHASDWLCSLIVADACDWITDTEEHSGGAYEKVIYWAFQKQGLFNSAPPDVDVYIDDGRQGEYQYQPDHTNCLSIWNRLAGDGLEGHQTPVSDVPNFAYVKIKNGGSKAAASVVVNAFQNKPQGQLVFPDDWQPMQPSALPASDLPPGSPEVTVGPFTWTPSASDNVILMAVSATGDASNLAKFSDGKSIPDWRLVPTDNNIGMRKV
jgi:zinc metalloprotease ZmpB